MKAFNTKKIERVMNLIPYVSEKVLAISKTLAFCYKSGCIILRNKNTKELVSKKRIHSRVKSFFILERLMRLEPRVAVALSEEVFLFSDHGKILKYDARDNAVQEIHSFARGMNNPLSFCTREENGKATEIIYGEYIWNQNMDAVSIYKYDLRTWKEVYSFPANSIKHIHNVFYDCFENCYIIVTGDDDHESAIWKADVEFKNVEKIVGDSQKYRACVVYPTEKGLFYATDTPLEQNWLYFLDKNNNLHEVHKMPGPCIYGRVFRDALYLATSVEGDPTLGGWKYRLSNKLGRGVYDRYVHIYRCNKDGVVEHIAKLKKDIFPMWLFQFGNAQFPPADDGLYISTQSTVEKGTYKVKFDE